MNMKVPIPQDVVEYFGKATYDEFWEELEPLLRDSIHDFREVTYARAASRHFHLLCKQSGINPEDYDSMESYIDAMRVERILERHSYSQHRHVAVNPKTTKPTAKTVADYKVYRAFPNLSRKMDAELDLLCKLVITGQNSLITLRNLQGYYEFHLYRLELIILYIDNDEENPRAAELIKKLNDLSDVAHAFKSSDITTELDFTIPQPKQG